MNEKSILTSDKCILCNKNLREGIQYNDNSHFIACNKPYFFGKWNDSRSIENKDCCNLCYYAKEYYCCKKLNKLCEFHERFSKIEKIEIILKILK